MQVVAQRVLLRPFASADGDEVHVYASDPAVCFFTDWGPNSPADTAEFVARAVSEGAPANIAVTLVEDVLGAAGVVPAGTVVGSLSAVPASTGTGHELGWVVRRDLWGQGIATEAVAALIGWLAAEHGVREFVARCRPQNRASSRVMEHVGMSYLERIPNDVVIKGVPADSEIYRLVIAP